MKGHFSIMCDSYLGELSFGNLGEKGGLGYLNDYVEETGNVFTIGSLVAHDVVEHSSKHRTATHVTFEDEIRALGATEFVRCSEGFNFFSELLGLVEYCSRDIKPVPYITGKFLLDDGRVSTGLIRYLIQNGTNPSNARNTAYQFAWGNYQKEIQFDNESWVVRSAFTFIECNVNSLLKQMKYEENYYSGVSVFFDTVKHIFRYRFKR